MSLLLLSRLCCRVAVLLLFPRLWMPTRGVAVLLFCRCLFLDGIPRFGRVVIGELGRWWERNGGLARSSSSDDFEVK